MARRTSLLRNRLPRIQDTAAFPASGICGAIQAMASRCTRLPALTRRRPRLALVDRCRRTLPGIRRVAGVWFQVASACFSISCNRRNNILPAPTAVLRLTRLSPSHSVADTIRFARFTSSSDGDHPVVVQSIISSAIVFSPVVPVRPFPACMWVVSSPGSSRAAWCPVCASPEVSIRPESLDTLPGFLQVSAHSVPAVCESLVRLA